jgi:hypothetical protein
VARYGRLARARVYQAGPARQGERRQGRRDGDRSSPPVVIPARPTTPSRSAPKTALVDLKNARVERLVGARRHAWRLDGAVAAHLAVGDLDTLP